MSSRVLVCLGCGYTHIKMVEVIDKHLTFLEVRSKRIMEKMEVRAVDNLLRFNTSVFFTFLFPWNFYGQGTQKLFVRGFIHLRKLVRRILDSSICSKINVQSL